VKIAASKKKKNTVSRMANEVAPQGVDILKKSCSDLWLKGGNYIGERDFFFQFNDVQRLV
jgi:hypothetical protein